MDSKFPGDKEQIENQLLKLSLDIQQFTKSRIMKGQESMRSSIDTDRESLLLRLSHQDFNMFSSSGMSERESKLFGVEDNYLVEEIERLAYILDGALMTAEDYRSHELRNSSVQVFCSPEDIKSFHASLLLHENSPSFNLQLGNTQFTVNVGTACVSHDFTYDRAEIEDIQKQTGEVLIQKLALKERTEQVEATKRALEHYSNNIKILTIELIKDREEIERSKKVIAQEQNALKEYKEEMTNKMEDIKKSLDLLKDQLYLFGDHVNVLDNTNPQELKVNMPDDPEIIKQEISHLEKMLINSTGKLKDSVQTQINRLKTRLANLRSANILSLCSDSPSTDRTITDKNNGKIVPRSTTPIRDKMSGKVAKATHHRVASEMTYDKYTHNEPVVKEIDVIKARLEEKQEILGQREKQILKDLKVGKDADIYLFRKRLFVQEKDLTKMQNNIDKQKIKLAENEKRISQKEKEFCMKQSEFQDFIQQIREKLAVIIESID